MVDFNSAISAYANTATKIGGGPEMDAPVPTGPSFGDVLKEAAQNAIDTSRTAEDVTSKAALGQADLTEVVTAVSNAEVTLQSVVAVRDKVISAYQEIMRMPI